MRMGLFAIASPSNAAECIEALAYDKLSRITS